MKKITVIASIIGVGALACGVSAQNPDAAPGVPNMRERLMQRFHGGDGQPGQPGGPAGFAGGNHMQQGADILKHVLSNPEVAKKTGITDEQIKKIKDGQFEFEKKMTAMKSDAQIAQMDVKHLMESDKVDRAALEKAIDSAGAKELALRKAALLRMLDVKEILGQETIDKIKNMAREHMAQRMQQQGSGAPGGERPWLQQRHGAQPGPQGQNPQGGQRPWQQGPMNPPPENQPKS